MTRRAKWKLENLKKKQLSNYNKAINLFKNPILCEKNNTNIYKKEIRLSQRIIKSDFA